MELNWVEIVISILTGLAAAIPLVVQLVKYVQKAVKEKNWNKMLDMVMMGACHGQRICGQYQLRC